MNNPAMEDPAAVVEQPEPLDPEVEQFARGLISILECAICLHLVTRPKICSRGHLCCRKCIKKLLRRCPLCKTKYQERVPYIVLNVLHLLRDNNLDKLAEED